MKLAYFNTKNPYDKLTKQKICNIWGTKKLLSFYYVISEITYLSKYCQTYLVFMQSFPIIKNLRFLSCNSDRNSQKIFSQSSSFWILHLRCKSLSRHKNRPITRWCLICGKPFLYLRFHTYYHIIYKRLKSRTVTHLWLYPLVWDEKYKISRQRTQKKK